MWRKKDLYDLPFLCKSVFLGTKLFLARFGVLLFFSSSIGNSRHVQLDMNVSILSF